jgi:chemotaxis protein MotB
MESETGLFFESGSSSPTNSAREVLTVLAPELGKLPNQVSIEGHTDSQPFSAGANYSNWELSADRANACRRLMQQNGMRSDQVAEIRGFADQNLRNKSDPTDAANRRITLLVKYIQKQNSDQAAPAEGGAQAEPGKVEKSEPPTANH